MNYYDIYITDFDLLKFKRIKARQIFKTVVNFFGYTPEQVISKSRKREIVYVRYIYFCIARCTKNSLEEIGKITGHDHATVLRGSNEAIDVKEIRTEMRDVICERFSNINFERLVSDRYTFFNSIPRN
jgi:chromosomal replication initiation ATPase DnaA